MKNINQEESVIEEAFKSVDINDSGSVSKTVSKKGGALESPKNLFQNLLGPDIKFDFCLQ